MTRAERRHAAQRKAARVRRWVSWKCPWLTALEVAKRRETTVGSGRCHHLVGNALAEARARMNELEQVG